MNKSKHTVTIPVSDYTELMGIYDRYYELLRAMRTAMNYSPLSQERSILISSRKIIDIYREWITRYSDDMQDSEIIVG